MPMTTDGGRYAGDWPPGTTTMAQRVRGFDWSATPLGPIAKWSPELRSAVAFVVESGTPAALAWGEQLVTIYNDGFRPILGGKPEALGRPFGDVWHEVWHEIGPIAWRAMAGEATFIENYRLVINRFGAPEEAFFTFSYSPIRAADGTVLGLIDTVLETTGIVKAQRDLQAALHRLRESDERQAFLLRLSDSLKPLARAERAREIACRLLGEHLSAARVYYMEYEPEGGRGLVADDFRRPGLPSLAGRYPFEAFRTTYERISGGNTWVVPDVRADMRLAAHERELYAARGAVSWINVPLLRADKLEAVLCVVESRDRQWTASEIDLVENTAERLCAAIQQARAEAALRESEERLRQFGEAASDVLWIRDAETLAWEYLTPAFETIYGMSRDEALSRNGLRDWLELVVPEDRERVLANIRNVRAGERASFEYRIRRPGDGEICWLRDTDFPMRDADGRVTRIGGVGHDVTPLKQAEEHQALLLAELQHRVRNTLAVVRSIVRRTAEQSEGMEDLTAHLEGRIGAFARVQAAVTRDPSAGIDLMSIIADELRAGGGREGSNVTIRGEPVKLNHNAAEMIGLAVHELTTNAVKYGALWHRQGHVLVEWAASGDFLEFRWTESGMGDLAPPRRRGFGREVLEKTLGFQLDAETSLSFEPGGLRFRALIPVDKLLWRPPA